jgi:hypothetical protein
MKTKSDFETGDEIRIYKERRKAIQARYYQRHRRIIKLAMTLEIPMKDARAIHAREVRE